MTVEFIFLQLKQIFKLLTGNDIQKVSCISTVILHAAKERIKMSVCTHPCSGGLDWAIANPLKSLKNLLESFFKSNEITKTSKIYHGQFSYELVPNTAIKDFYNMNKVTSLDSGDSFIYVFECPQYQGQYQIIGPGERVELGNCGSIIVSPQTVPVDMVRSNAHPPAGFWELSGSLYLLHFSPVYRYV